METVVAMLWHSSVVDALWMMLWDFPGRVAGCPAMTVLWKHQGRWQSAHYSQCPENPTWHINLHLPRPCALRSKLLSRGPFGDQAWHVLLAAIRVTAFVASANAHARQAVPEEGSLTTIGNKRSLIRTPGAAPQQAERVRVR